MHPAIRIFGAFFLAIALTSGALYAIDHSLNAGESPAKAANAAPLAANPAPPTPTTATLATMPAAGDSPQLPPPINASRPLQENLGAIAKCKIDGKIVYTDKGCPQGSNAKPLQIIDNAVIPGVDQATIERTLRQPPPPLTQAAPSAAVIEPPVTSITTEAGVDCLALGRRLEWLDYMAHRRQPRYIRDRIQRERDELQTRRFWAHC